MLADLRKRTRPIMIIVAVGFIGGFLLGSTLCAVLTKRGSSRNRGQDMAERGFIGVVGDHKITQDEYRGAVAYITDKYKTENQLRDLSSEDYAQIETQAWEFLVSELTWGKLLQQAKVRTTEDEVLEIMKANPPEELRKNPSLLNDSGQFDREKYVSVMNDPKNQPYFAKYFRDLAEMLPKEKFRIDAVNSYRITGAEVNQALSAANSRRTITSLYFGPKLVTGQTDPTDAEIAAYYKAHPDEFQSREIRQLRYVRFTLAVTKDDSNQAAEQIQNAYKQLQSGEDFSLTMMDFSNLEAETTSVFVARSRLDARTDTVVKKLKPGQYSEPHVTDYGWQIVLLDSARGDSVALRRILVRLQMGTDAVATVRDSVRQFIDQSKQAGFDTVAQRMGQMIMRSRPIVDRKPSMAGMDLTSPSQVADWALAARQGDIMPEPVRGTSGFYVFQLSELKPAGQQKFEEAKEAAKWKVRQAGEKDAWLAKANEVLAQVKAGKALEQVAQENPNIELTTEQFDGTTDAQRRKGAEFAGAVSALEPGQKAGVIGTNWGAFIVRCDGKQDTGTLTRDRYFQQRNQSVSQELIQAFLKQPEIKDYRDPFSY